VAADDADLEPTAKRRRAPTRRSGRTHRRSTLTRDFYGSALDAAERIELEAAGEIEGLDREIALLRMKLRGVLEERPEDLQLMLRGIDLLVKAVSARYRLSKQAEEDLADSIANVIRGVGGALLPEAFADV
jgi:hypothetical protein